VYSINLVKKSEIFKSLILFLWSFWKFLTTKRTDYLLFVILDISNKKVFAVETICLSSFPDMAFERYCFNGWNIFSTHFFPKSVPEITSPVWLCSIMFVMISIFIDFWHAKCKFSHKIYCSLNAIKESDSSMHKRFFYYLLGLVYFV